MCNCEKSTSGNAGKRENSVLTPSSTIFPPKFQAQVLRCEFSREFGVTSTWMTSMTSSDWAVGCDSILDNAAGHAALRNLRPVIPYTQPLRKKKKYGHHIGHISKIKNVQERATKLVPELSIMTYKERLWPVKLSCLSYGRNWGDMTETYMILNEKYD